MRRQFQELSVIESNGYQAARVVLERLEHVTDEPVAEWAKRLLLEGKYAKGLYVAERGHSYDDSSGEDVDSGADLVADGMGTVKVLP